MAVPTFIAPFPSATLPTLLIVSPLIVIIIIIAGFSLHMAVENLGYQTRTVIGHNLSPTPWHPFNKEPNPNPSLTPTILFRCSYLSCRRLPFPTPTAPPTTSSPSAAACPTFYRHIHQDLKPFRRSGVSRSSLAEAQKHAAMRIVVIGGTRLYVDLYYACVQSRAMFTIWGMLMLLRRYPGMVPDVDMMFDCMDRPSLNRTLFDDGGGGGGGGGLPVPPLLFRYCTSRDHLDIPFPDWSFWGWSEINIKPWKEELRNIKLGSQAKRWVEKDANAYWKGNPDVQSPLRVALLGCNDSKLWGAQIMRQNWVEEAKDGFRKSALSNQCDHRYKIYAEGFAWSVSLKYILACGSLSLLIDPYYQDFFSRGLIPKVNYWPINPVNLCPSIKATVDWGNEHPAEAEAIGENAQAHMEEINMDRVYDYMYHLISEYSKLQDFKPTPPPSAQEVCVESILCLADEKQRKFLESSYTSPASSVPCALPET